MADIVMEALIDSAVDRLKASGHAVNRQTIMTDNVYRAQFSKMVSATALSSSDDKILIACRDLLKELISDYAGEQLVMDFFRSEEFKRLFKTELQPLDKYTDKYEGHSRICGDHIELTAQRVKLDIGYQFTAIGAKVEGCAICKASTAKLVETLTGKTTKDIERFKVRLAHEEFKAVPYGRLPCFELPWETLSEK